MTHLHNGTFVQQKGDQAAATHNITGKALKLRRLAKYPHTVEANVHVWEANCSAGALPAGLSIVFLPGN